MCLVKTSARKIKEAGKSIEESVWREHMLQNSTCKLILQWEWNVFWQQIKAGARDREKKRKWEEYEQPKVELGRKQHWEL